MPVPLHWHNEPFLLISVLGVGWLYALFTWPLRSNIVEGQIAYPWKQGAFFYFALLLTYLTVASPLDQVGEDFLFSLHMVQHMLLIYVLPPLFLWATPQWLVDYFLQNRNFYQCMRILMHPVCGGLCFTLCYTLWHIPSLYEAALQNKLIHIFEHWTMFLTAIQIWWPVLSPSRILPPASYPIRMLFVFVLMVGQFPVFGFLTFSGEVFYATYEFAPRIFELTPLQDQVLGGVIMKLFNMVVSLIVLCTSFYCWYKSQDRPEFA